MRPLSRRSTKTYCFSIKNQSIAVETSSRNSAVVHAGSYHSDMPNKNYFYVGGRLLIEEY